MSDTFSDRWQKIFGSAVRKNILPVQTNILGFSKVFSKRELLIVQKRERKLQTSVKKTYHLNGWFSFHLLKMVETNKNDNLAITSQ